MFLVECIVWNIGLETRHGLSILSTNIWMLCIEWFNHLNLKNDKDCFNHECINPKQTL